MGSSAVISFQEALVGILNGLSGENGVRWTYLRRPEWFGGTSQITEGNNAWSAHRRFDGWRDIRSRSNTYSRLSESLKEATAIHEMAEILRPAEHLEQALKQRRGLELPGTI